MAMRIKAPDAFDAKDDFIKIPREADFMVG
jgi:hypothetical protein